MWWFITRIVITPTVAAFPARMKAALTGYFFIKTGFLFVWCHFSAPTIMDDFPPSVSAVNSISCSRVWFIVLWAHQATQSFVRQIFAACSQRETLERWERSGAPPWMYKIKAIVKENDASLPLQCSSSAFEQEGNICPHVLLLSAVMMCSLQFRCYSSISGVHYCPPTYLHYVKTGKCFTEQHLIFLETLPKSTHYFSGSGQNEFLQLDLQTLN